MKQIIIKILLCALHKLGWKAQNTGLPHNIPTQDLRPLNFQLLVEFPPYLTSGATIKDATNKMLLAACNELRPLISKIDITQNKILLSLKLWVKDKADE